MVSLAAPLSSVSYSQRVVHTQRKQSFGPPDDAHSPSRTQFVRCASLIRRIGLACTSIR